MKRLGIVAGIILVVGLAAGAWASSSRFSDVAEDHPQRDAIEWSVDQGLLPLDGNSFRPGAGVTRADLATVLHSMEHQWDLDIIRYVSGYEISTYTLGLEFELLQYCDDLSLDIELLRADGRLAGASGGLWLSIDEGPFTPGDVVTIEVHHFGVDLSGDLGLEWSGECLVNFGKRLLPETS